MSLMDEVERRRFLDTLRRDDDFRAAVRRELLAELLNLPQTVTTLVDVVAQQRQDFGALAAQVTALAAQIATLVDVVAQQRQDFTALATDVRDYTERTITLIGEGFTAVRAEISELRTDMETGFTAVRAEFDQAHAEIAVIKDQLAS